jgi:hypothetical protein
VGGDMLAGAWNGETIFWLSDGEVRCKNPDEDIIRKMVAMSERLYGTVQGDDGEVYRANGTTFEPKSKAPSQTHPNIFVQIRSWLSNRRKQSNIQQTGPVFRAGQRVRNQWGDLGTIVSADRNAKSGLGSVHVLLDDGRHQHLGYIASGLEVVDDAAKGEQTSESAGRL